MAEIKWTEAQKSAIGLSGRNILVSAAAGSGKTAVLVERIISRISDENDPADISSFIVITFTRAAAQQMRSKIYSGIKKKLAADPENRHLRAQLIRLAGAKICTIDSLCSDIVRENFQYTDAEPGLRIADEAELSMLRNDVLGTMLEEHFADPSSEFLDVITAYTDKSDAKIEEMILSLYSFAQSHPEPEKWIQGCAAAYASGQETEENTEWIKYLGSYVNTVIESIRKRAEEGLAVCDEPDGPAAYAVQFEKYKTLVRDLTAPDTPFDQKGFLIRSFLADKQRLPGVRGVDEGLKEYAKYLNSSIADTLEDLAKNIFTDDYISLSEDMKKCSPAADVICGLAQEFSRRFSQAKQERRITDFNDIEHNAFKILISRAEDGSLLRDEKGYIPSEPARNMARGITEIIVDEYQDTNELQDAILFALSSEREGRPDVFMVGDVKQSIYGFRMACPELFTEKYNSYAGSDDKNARIILSENFRSRRQILDLVNCTFERAMIPEIGGIDYKDGGSMTFGAKDMYAQEDEGAAYVPEVVFINESAADGGKLTEGLEIALRIDDLIRNGKVTDKETGLLREVRYDDIVILTRTSNNPEILKSLKTMNIPVISSSGKGFFDTFEIRLTLDLLGIIDNPLQDIPFTAVLTSPLVGLNANDLARIKISMDGCNMSMYEACRKITEEKQRSAAERGVPEDQAEGSLARLTVFMRKLEDYRRRAVYMDINALTDYVLEDSGLYNILTAMPGGSGRRANIDFLKAKVKDFAGSSYSGLFDLIRYIEQLKRSDIDFGLADAAEGVCAVRMMTIHRSKGLEFPVVFLAGAGKRYNLTDTSKSIILDRDLGLGMELRDGDQRTVKSTLLMQVIKIKKKTDLCAEEMRLLYVAMTRAKEILTITANNKLSRSGTRKWIFEGAGGTDFCSVLNANSYQALLGPVIAEGKAQQLFAFAEIGDDIIQDNTAAGTFRFGISDLHAVQEETEKNVIPGPDLREKIERLLAEGAEEAGVRKTFVYPHAAAVNMPVKITASKLEEHAYAAEESGSGYIKRTGLTGAERGTAYHTFFEYLDYGSFKENSTEEVCEMTEKLTNEGHLNSEEAAAIEPEKIVMFLRSNTGKRMKYAAEHGNLVREQQFIMSFEDGGEQRILQGIIDCFFEEDGKIVLVDYKTDRGKTEAEFISTYKPQQDAYKAAIEAAMKKPVKEQIIFALETGSEIYL